MNENLNDQVNTYMLGLGCVSTKAWIQTGDGGYIKPYFDAEKRMKLVMASLNIMQFAIYSNPEMVGFA